MVNDSRLANSASSSLNDEIETVETLVIGAGPVRGLFWLQCCLTDNHRLVLELRSDYINSTGVSYLWTRMSNEEVLLVRTRLQRDSCLTMVDT